MTATTELLTKTKSKTKSKAVEKENSLPVIAEELQSLTKVQANHKLNELLEAEGMNDFQLGAILALYQDNPDWWEGAEKFKDFVKTGAVITIHYRKVMYLIKIYHCLIENDIQWDTVKALGWTKLRILVNVLKKDNVDEWVEKASVLTSLQLEAAVKETLSAGVDEDKGKITSDVSTMTFKLHPDQKEQVKMALQKAREELSTEYDSVALEGICTSFIGGSFELPEISLIEVLKGVSYTEALKAFEQVYPTIDVTVAVINE